METTCVLCGKELGEQGFRICESCKAETMKNGTARERLRRAEFWHRMACDIEAAFEVKS